MENWIIFHLDSYKNTYIEYCDKEVAICHCALSMSQILNGLSEVEYTQFHKYEKKMLWSSLKLFSEQCIERINYALNCEDVVEKEAVISDIENSISQIMEVCKNIFDSTSNAERKMFQSLSVDTSMYELSPKLCAYYASILEDMVTLFEGENPKYAFVIYPTLRSTIEAKILFKTRKDSGRVVIVYISESAMEDFQLVATCLVHEAFHVITNRERHRKLRSRYFLLHMLSYIQLLLFQGIAVSEDEVRRNQIEKNLMEQWLGDVFLLNEDFGKETENSKRFYSENLKKEVSNTIKRCLVDMSKNFDESFMRQIYDNYKPKDYRSFKNDIIEVRKCMGQLRNNLNQIILGNKVSAIADLIMSIYRETYADIACILTLDLSSKQYSSAFDRSIQFGYEKVKYQDWNKDVREYLVTNTVLNSVPAVLKHEWSEHMKSMKERLQMNTQRKTQNLNMKKDEGEESARQSEGSYVNIKITDSILQIFQGYLYACSDALSFRLQEMEGIQAFRNRMQEIVAGDDGILIKILRGTVY